MHVLNQLLDFNASQIEYQKAKASGFSETARAMSFIVDDFKKAIDRRDKHMAARQEFGSAFPAMMSDRSNRIPGDCPTR